MSEIVKMPRLSDTMEEGVLIKWHKKVGDKVEEGDLLAEIETDKATMEFESFQSGYLLRIDVQEGATVGVDASICVLGSKGEPISSDVADVAPSTEVKILPDSKASSNMDGVAVVTMPKLSDTMEEGRLVKWHKEVGDKVEEGDLLAEIETDKATMEFESFQTGFLLHKGIGEGETAEVEATIAILGSDKGANVSEILASQEKSNRPALVVVTDTFPGSVLVDIPEKPEDGDGTRQRIKASPLARKMAKDQSIDLSNIQGSGENGRIIRKDIEGYKPQLTRGGGDDTVFDDVQPSKETLRTPLSGMRKTIAKRLTGSKFSAPHYYVSFEVNMKQAIMARKAINEPGDVKISYNDLVIKAVACSLERYPSVNSTWTDQEIITHGSVNIGVAVAIEDGLVVPTLFDAPLKNLARINSEVKSLARKAKEKKLTPKEMEGSTFTISNLGMFGVYSFTSIINQPNAAILSVGGILETPVVENGQVVPGHMMNLTLACDHRVVDGAVAAAFLGNVRQMLEQPITMLA